MSEKSIIVLIHYRLKILDPIFMSISMQNFTLYPLQNPLFLRPFVAFSLSSGKIHPR
jgi:hypothetical protein